MMVKRILPFFCGAVLLLCSCSENEKPKHVAVGTSREDIPSSDSAAAPVQFIPDPTFGGTNMEIYSASGPENIARGVLQASNGVYWFASWNGLYSYDGSTFTNHTLKDGLSRHRVYSVREDSKGNIWACTAGAGVYRYDGKAFRNFSTRDGLSSNNVFVAFEDRAGNLWFGSDSGVSKYDYKSAENFAIDSLTGNVLSIAQDCDGNMWFGGTRGCYRYIDNRFTALLTDQGAMIPAMAMHADANCTMWIAGSNGVFMFDRKLRKVLSNPSTHLTEDKAGHMLITASDEKAGSTEGMYIFRYNGGTVDTVTQRTGYSGAGAQVFGVIEDQQNHIWFGTVQGVCELNGATTIAHYAK
jgi:ligand-binding sensor domain-containing protein